MDDPAITEGYIEVPGGRVWYQIIGADRPGVPARCRPEQGYGAWAANL